MRPKNKIVICVKDHKLLKQLARIAKPVFEVIGCTDPEITAQSIVPSEISTFITDSCALLRRSREMNANGHRVLVTDFRDLREIVAGVQDRTVHHIVKLPVQARDFLSTLMIVFPAPRVFGGKSRARNAGVGYWGARN